MTPAILVLALLARGPGQHTQDYHQGARGSVVSGGPLARYLSPTGNTVSMSGVTFTRNSAATCTDASGNVTKLGNNVPCTAGGYHARPQTSNLLSYSEDLDVAGTWLQSATAPATLTVTKNYAIAPDGSQTAERILAANGGGNLSFSLRQSVAVTAGQAYEFTFYAQKNGGTEANYRVYDITHSADIVAATSYFSQLTASWTRIKVAFTAPAGCTSVYVYPNTGDNAAGASSDVSVWGAQLEASAFADDYCPSSSTPGTCAAEVATVATPPGMSLTEGCSRVCVTPSWTGNAPATSAWLTAHASDGHARLLLSGSGTQAVFGSDGTHTATATTTFTVGGRRCYRTTWSAAAGTIAASDLTSGASSSASGFTGFAAFDVTVAIGAEGTVGQPLGSILDSVVFGSSVSGCN